MNTPRSILVKALTQDELNDKVKNSFGEYAPAFLKMSYTELISDPESKNVFCLISNFNYRKYNTGEKVLDFWKKLNVSAIKYGRKNTAILNNGQEILIEPKDLTPLIKYNLERRA